MNGGRERKLSQEAALHLPGCLRLHLTDVLTRHVLIVGLSLILDQDKQMELKFDGGMLRATRVSTHTWF